MKKFKKTLLIVLSLVLVSALSVVGTVAYLTSQDSDVNVMTLGNVKIEQHEYERVVNEDGTYKTDTIDDRISYVLQDFTQGKPLLPIVGDPNEPGGSAAYAGWDSIPVRMSQVNSYGGMKVFAGKNAQDKFVTVENTGKTDAYVRTIIAIEIGSTDGALIGQSYQDSAWKRTSVGNIVINGNTYRVFEYNYPGAPLGDGTYRHENGVLPAGETTYPNLAQVYLKHNATNEDMEAIDGNKNGTLDILVISQAAQVAGFADAKTALDTAFGKSSEKAAEWFGGMGKVQFVGAETDKDQLTGEEAKEILESVEAGNDLIVDEKMDLLGFDTNEVDAKGATVTLNGVGPEAYGYLAFIPDEGEDVTVSNLNVTGSGFVEVGHYGMGGGQYVLNNVTIKNLAATLKNTDKGFSLGCAFMGMGDVTLNDCVMTGTTAVQDGVMPIDLGCGQAWSGYKDGNDNKLSTTINRGKYGTIYCWSHSIVSITGAEVDTLNAAPINGTVTIKSGTSIDTLNIAYGTSAASAARLSKLVIEDGATIGKIVFSDEDHAAVTFSTMADWNAYVAENIK